MQAEQSIRFLTSACRKCSAPLPPSALFCHLCGARQDRPQRRSRTRPNGAGTAYKRGKTWTAKLCVKTREDGRTWMKPYTKGGFTSRSAALAYAAQLVQVQQDAPSGRTLDHYWQLFKENRLTRLSASKQTAYKIAYNKLESVQFKPVSAIGVKTLQQIINEKAPTYYPARDMKNLLAHLYRLIMADGEALSSPAALIELPRLEEKESEAFTDTEQAAIWERYSQGDVFLGYILLMMYTGMMPGELLTCRKEHILWDQRKILGCGMKTKHRKETPIVLADYLIPILRALCLFSAGEKLLTMNKDSFYKEYYAALERCGCRRLTPYSCRHTTGTKLDVDQGAAPSVIAKVLRQKTLRVQDRYKHPDMGDALEAVNGLRFVEPC